MARQARDCNSCAEWESDLVGNIVKTDGFFVPNPTKGIPAAKEARPESVTRLGPTCEILGIVRGNRGPLWKQAANGKFRLLLALPALGKVLPTVKSDLHSWRV